MTTRRMVIALITVPMFISTVTGIRYSFSQTNEPRLHPPKRSAGAVKKAIQIQDTTGDFAPLSKPKPGDWLDAHPEPGQTFEQFLAQPRNKLSVSRTTIYLKPIWNFDTSNGPPLTTLREFTERYFKVPVVLLPQIKPPKDEFSPRINGFTRNLQVNASDVLKYLLDFVPPDAYCVLGITMVDLYPDPEWNFVFGLASYTDRVGVFSFARYCPAFYTKTSDSAARALILLRSCKILAHETGHMFGMAHCIAYRCVMNGCNSLEENDAQPIHLCPSCIRKLRHAVGFDIGSRYEALGAFYSRQGFVDEAQWIGRRLR